MEADRHQLQDWEHYVKHFHSTPDPNAALSDNTWRWNRTKPLTLAYLIQQLHIKSQIEEFSATIPFRITILGGNAEEEENAIEYWKDVFEEVLDPKHEKGIQLSIVMIGPQMSSERHNTTVAVSPALSLTFYKGRFHDYREELVDQQKYQDPHLFIAFHRFIFFLTTTWVLLSSSSS